MRKLLPLTAVLLYACASTPPQPVVLSDLTSFEIKERIVQLEAEKLSCAEDQSVPVIGYQLCPLAKATYIRTELSAAKRAHDLRLAP